MTYWRMQLHPADAGDAIMHTAKCLSRRYIGLDFARDVGDLLTVSQDALPENQKRYFAFAREMVEGDRVLLFAHHFPFALVRVAGPYNFIRAAVPELDLWCCHFRAVDDIRYFGDFVTNAREWPAITMTETIQPLRDPASASFRLIDRWLGSNQ